MSGVARSRVREVLDLALERPSTEREAFVAGACGQDAGLRAEVMSLLEALDRAGDLLEPPAAADRFGPAAASEPLTGLQFGSYVVQEQIGAGGMGEVYRGTDTRLGRTVAVKALPAELAHDPHRRARFEQEARALAALQHPNIAAIFGAEDTARGPVLVLEYVPGATLAEVIAKGPLELPEAMRIGRQIAMALEAAHAVGVVHRDLKPANVRITPEGVAKVLDFGIAKLVGTPDRAAVRCEEQPVANVAHTAAGAVLGTAAYMSPEQARGKQTDRRTDLWALGCVLYEMLAGRKAFPGKTGSDTVASVLGGDPDWARLAACGPMPEALTRLLRRCLEKDVDRRLRDAGDARLELEEALASPARVSDTKGGRRAWLLAVAAAGLGAGILGVGLGLRWRGAQPATPARFSFQVPQRLPLSWDTGASFAVSPDGQALAFAGYIAGKDQWLFLRPMDQTEPKAMSLAATVRTPCFSPDGLWVAFTDGNGGHLKRVKLEDGHVDDFGCVAEPEGIAWTDAGELVYAYAHALWRVPAASPGAATVRLTSIGPDELSHAQPCAVPGTNVVVFTSVRRVDRRSVCAVEGVNLSTGQRRRLNDNAWTAVAVSGTSLVFCREDGVYAATFDSVNLQLSGPSVRVLDPLARGTELLPVARMTASKSGTMVYLPGAATFTPTNLAWIDREGVLRTVHEGTAEISAVRVSPDATRIAFASGEPSEPLAIWVKDLERGTLSRITPDDRRNRDFPVWSPDGRSLIVESTSDGACRLELWPADKSDGLKVLYQGQGDEHVTPTDVLPDGSAVLATRSSTGGDNPDLFCIGLHPGAGESVPPVRLLPAPGERAGGRFSPDGTMLLYTAWEGEKQTIVLQPWPAMDYRLQVSATEGRRATWKADGGAIYYRVRNELYEVDVRRAPLIKLGPPRLVLDNLPETRYEPAPDGQSFLITAPPGPLESGTRFGVILNFDAQVRAAIAASRRGAIPNR